MWIFTWTLSESNHYWKQEVMQQRSVFHTPIQKQQHLRLTLSSPTSNSMPISLLLPTLEQLKVKGCCLFLNPTAATTKTVWLKILYNKWSIFLQCHCNDFYRHCLYLQRGGRASSGNCFKRHLTPRRCVYSSSSCFPLSVSDSLLLFKSVSHSYLIALLILCDLGSILMYFGMQRKHKQRADIGPKVKKK